MEEKEETRQEKGKGEEPSGEIQGGALKKEAPEETPQIKEAAPPTAPKQAEEKKGAEEPPQKAKEKEKGKAEKPKNCSQCNKPMERKSWYYRNAKYFCSKGCWRASQEKVA